MTTTPTTSTTRALAQLVDQLVSLDGSAVCPGNSAIMTSAEYQQALDEYKNSPLTEQDRPAFNRTFRNTATRAYSVEAAPDLTDKEWLRKVLPTEVAVFLASIHAEYAERGEAPDPKLEFDFADGQERFKVFVDDGKALRRALGNLLLADRRTSLPR